LYEGSNVFLAAIVAASFCLFAGWYIVPHAQPDDAIGQAMRMEMFTEWQDGCLQMRYKVRKLLVVEVISWW
jgi:hypothetical protein